jgi:hypothetical protein
MHAILATCCRCVLFGSCRHDVTSQLSPALLHTNRHAECKVSYEESHVTRAWFQELLWRPGYRWEDNIKKDLEDGV